MSINHNGFQLQDIGQRTDQEDRCLCLTAEFDGYKLSTIAVADGMGGHEAGEVAAEIAIKSVKKLHEILVDEKLTDWNIIRNKLDSTFHQANQDILDTVSSDPSKSGMGTTLTCAIIINSQVVVSHIGDSRAYLIEANDISQLTVDHTAFQDAIERGISVENSGVGLNAIMHCIDGSEDLRVDVYPKSEDKSFFHIGKRVLLLCSDGLCGAVDEEIIFNTLLNSGSLKEFLQNLIILAKNFKSSDNISVVGFETGEFNYHSSLSNTIHNTNKNFYLRLKKILAVFTILLTFVILFALLEETNTISTGYLSYFKTDEINLSADEVEAGLHYTISLISPNEKSEIQHPDSVQFIWSHRHVNKANINCYKLEINQIEEPSSDVYYFSISDSLFSHSISDSVVTVLPRENLLSKKSAYSWKIIPNISAPPDYCKELIIKSSVAKEFITSEN